MCQTISSNCLLINCYRQLHADIKEDFLVRIEAVFGVERADASQLYDVLLQCMDHRESVRKRPFGNMMLWFDTHTDLTSTCLWTTDNHLWLRVRGPNGSWCSHFDSYSQGYFFFSSWLSQKTFVFVEMLTFHSRKTAALINNINNCCILWRFNTLRFTVVQTQGLDFLVHLNGTAIISVKLGLFPLRQVKCLLWLKVFYSLKALRLKFCCFRYLLCDVQAPKRVQRSSWVWH